MLAVMSVTEFVDIKFSCNVELPQGRPPVVPLLVYSELKVFRIF
jgi:hypothetical protein